MIQTFFKQLIRSISHRKLLNGINIISLGIGLACVILMTTYIIHEFSFDSYYQNVANTYRVIDGKDSYTYYPMGDLFKTEIPEVESVCRMFSIGVKVRQGLDYIDEGSACLSDTNIISVFDLKLVSGNKSEILKAPDEIIVSQKLAHKYFPDENPVGKTMELAVGQSLLHYKISGVFKDIPSNSSLQTQIIGNIENAFSMLYDLTYMIGASDKKVEKDYHQVWEQNMFTTFVMLNPNAEIARVEEKCSALCDQHRHVEDGQKITLQPITRMYLHSSHLENTGSLVTNQLGSIKIFMGIGLLILLVAIINFILISNADNNLALKEIACRKVNGASRRQLLWGYIFRSVTIAMFSLIPAILLVNLLIPVFNNLFQKNLSIQLMMQWPYLTSLLLITIITGVISGLYLGLYVTKIKPSTLLQKGTMNPGRKSHFKGSLVVVQFVVFIFLFSCFMIMQKQYNFALHKDLGFNTNNLIALNINNQGLTDKVEYLENKLKSYPGVVDCKPTSFTVPPSNNSLLFQYKNQDTGEPMTMEALVFGNGIVNMLHIPIIDGRDFEPTDGGFGGKFMINEAAARKFNIRAGEKFSGFDIIGVVKNFHYHSLYQPVKPVFIAQQAQNYQYLLIKTNGDNKKVVEYCRQICHEISPNYYLSWELLDDRIEGFYAKEDKQMGTIGFFAGLAMILSVLGLLAFVTLNLVKRTKELGIRKVNGAKLTDIMQLLHKDFLIWISIAFVIACPLAFYSMNRWLEDFAYKTNLSWWIFALAGFTALVIAVITISWQTYRAAKRNPVEALRYE